MTSTNTDQEWMTVLREACARTSQRDVSERLNVSVTVVNQALKGSYKASLSNLEARVRGELMAETVTCPVLADISRRKCQDNQKRTFAATNPTRVQVYFACRGGCRHSALPDESQKRRYDE